MVSPRRRPSKRMSSVRGRSLSWRSMAEAYRPAAKKPPRLPDFARIAGHRGAMKTSLVLRILVVAFVACALLIPIALIQGKIHERRSLADTVERTFALETSGAQTLVGPLLALTCEETVVVERQVMRAGKAETLAESKKIDCPTGYFPPSALRITGSVPVETLRRGIYPIRLYRGGLDISAEFQWPRPASPNGANPRRWKQARLLTSVSDPRGIKE